MIRILSWLLVIFAIWYLLTNPDGAAGFVRDVFGWLQHVGASLSSFVDNL